MLDPRNGKPITSFGKQGRARTGHFRVAPAVHNTLILLSGYEGDAFALDLETGQERWQFHTGPRAGEYGHETWSQVEAVFPFGPARSWGLQSGRSRSEP